MSVVVRADGDCPRRHDRSATTARRGAGRRRLPNVRRSGLVEHSRGLGSHDHVCWGYEDAAEFRCRAREFLREGLGRGQQVWYVASGKVTELVGHLRGLDGYDAARAAGAARVIPLQKMYGAHTTVDPAAAVKAYAAATEAALAAGFTGLRVAVDCTPLVRTAEQVMAFAQYEYQADNYMAVNRFSTLCAFHAPTVGEPTMTQLACMHPASNELPARFRLYGSVDCTATVTGQLDLSNQDLLQLALQYADVQPAHGQLLLDATRLTFIDHTSLLLIAEQAHRHRAILTLRASWPGLPRLVQLLNLPGVQVMESA